MKRKQFLIIGGYGYIGTHLYDYLDKKYTFKNYQRDTEGLADCQIVDIDSPSRVAIKIEEIQKSDIVFDAVFYLAADSMVADGIMSPFSTLDNNISSMINYIKMLRGKFKTWVFASSSSVYADKAMPWSFKETDKLKVASIGNTVYNDNTYAISKIIGEKVLQAAAHEFGMKSIALRFGNVAGTDSTATSGRIWKNHLIPKLIFNSNEEFVFNGDPSDYARDYVHILDVCESLDIAWQYSLQSGKDFDVFNIGSGISESNWSVFTKVENHLSKSISYVVGPARPGETKNIQLDISKAQKYLGWNPKLSLDDIIKSYVGVI